MAAGIWREVSREEGKRRSVGSVSATTTDGGDCHSDRIGVNAVTERAELENRRWRKFASGVAPPPRVFLQNAEKNEVIGKRVKKLYKLLKGSGLKLFCLQQFVDVVVRERVEVR